uniref:Uncharacterized protein n=1 Tax=Anguilla anguilla TaxID=7936 RepID=A0A0E9S124_ANGAN
MSVFVGWLSYLLGMALNAVLLKPKQMLLCRAELLSSPLLCHRCCMSVNTCDF